MSSIDERIVELQLDNDDFEKRAKVTNDTLDDLKKHLELDGATKGLSDVQSAADSMNLSTIADGIESISNAFSALGIIGINVLSNLAQSALNFAKDAVGSILDPIIQGGNKRAQALELARFQFQGLGLDIEATMDAANRAVDGTAYSLDQAATAAAQFGASGITAGHGLYEALRSISGVAAQTGRGYDDLSQVFLKVAGQGRLMGDDLLSLGSRGVNAAAILGKALGHSEADIRDMVTKGKIDFQTFSDVMLQTFGENAGKANETFQGAMSNMRAALARIGAAWFTPWNEAQRTGIVAMIPLINMFKNALIPVLNVFTDLAQLKATNLSDFLADLTSNTKFAENLTMAFKNLSSVVKGVLEAFQAGFSEIFPAATVDNVVNVVHAIRMFLATLIPTGQEAEDLKNTFAGFFAILDIGWQILSRVFKLIFNLIGVFSTGEGNVLSFTGSIGEFLVKIDKALKSGDGLNKFFAGLESVLKKPIELIKILGDWVIFLIQAFHDLATGGEITEFFDDLGERFSGFVKLGEFFVKVWEGLKRVLETVLAILAPMVLVVVDAAKAIGQQIAASFKNLSFDDAINALNAGLFGGFLLIVNRFFNLIKGVVSGDGIGIVQAIKGVFGQLESNLKSLQANTQAKTLKEIAIAVALLAAAAIALTMVDPIKLTASLGAMTIMMGQLMGSLALMVQIMGDKKLLLLPLVASSLIMLATSLVIFAGAIAIIAALPLEKARQGLGGIVVALGALVGAVALLNKMGPRVLIGVSALYILSGALLVISGAIAIVAALPLERAAQGVLGLIAMVLTLVGAVALLNLMGPKALIGAAAIQMLAGAIIVIASAVAILAALPLDRLIAGGVAFIVVLGAMVGAAALLALVGPLVLVGAAAIVLMSGAMILAATGILIFANAMKILATMSWDDIGRTLVILAGGLTILSIAMIAMTFGAVGAVAMIAAAAAIMVLANALKIVATMSWDDIGRSMVVLAGSMLILALAALAFQEAALGAAAMIAVAIAITILAPALKLLGSMSWDEIGRGLTVLSASLAILAVLGLALIPASVGFLLLGGAILLMGAGIFLAATGASALAIAISALIAVGSAGIAMFITALRAFAAEIPALAYKIAEGIMIIVKYIGDNAPILVGAFVSLLIAMLDAINQVVPKIIETGTSIMLAFIESLKALIPLLIETGLVIIESFMQSVADHIEDIAKLGLEIIENFMDGISDGLPGLIDSGINLIISFINALSEGIKQNTAEINKATAKLVLAIADGVSAAIRSNTTAIRKAGEKIGSALLDGAKNLLGINSPSKVFRDYVMGAVFEGVEDGTDKNINRASSAGEDIGNSMINGVQKSILDIGKAIDLNIDSQPTIRPVFDLTDIQAGTGQIAGMLASSTPALSLDGTIANVSSTNAGYEATMRTMTDADGEPISDIGKTTYIQNNYSPKALSPAEIYRQTKSQLSVAKEELEKNAN